MALQDEAVAKAHPPGGSKPRPPNPLMLGLSAPRYILFHLRLIKGPDLEQALLVLTLEGIRLVGGVVRGVGGGLSVSFEGMDDGHQPTKTTTKPNPKSQTHSCCATWRRSWRRTWRWSSAGAAWPSFSRRTTSRCVRLDGCGWLGPGNASDATSDVWYRPIIIQLIINHPTQQPNEKQILHCRDLVPVLARLRGALKARLRGYRDGLGVNVAGLRLLKREVEEDRNAFVVDVGDGGEGGKRARV